MRFKQLLACFVSLSWAVYAYAGQVAGTSVVLDPPGGFVVSDRFAGFIDPESGASIVVSELPGEYAQMSAAFGDAGVMRTRGMTLLGQAETQVDARRALLVEARQDVQGQRYKKWLAVVEREQGVALLVASLPEAAVDRQENDLKKSLLGARFGAPSDPYQALGFSITPTAPFKYAKAIGQMLVISPEGVIPARETDTPMLVAGLSASHGAVIADRKAFAEQRVRQVAKIQDTRIERSTPVKIGGLPGYATLASGKQEASGAARTLYQVMLFDQDGYALIQGITPSKSRVKYLPMFKRMADTFAMKR